MIFWLWWIAEETPATNNSPIFSYHASQTPHTLAYRTVSVAKKVEDGATAKDSRACSVVRCFLLEGKDRREHQQRHPDHVVQVCLIVDRVGDTTAEEHGVQVCLIVDRVDDTLADEQVVQVCLIVRHVEDTPVAS